MAKSNKARFTIVGGIIVIVLIVAIALASAGTASTAMSVAEAAQESSRGKSVEVTGNVVDNSFSIDGNILRFKIYDANDPQATLGVVYDQGVAATFGNGVTAICKGKVGDDGVLQCSSLVTKCPSKYETATDALTVSELRSYGKSVIDKPVKVSGTLRGGSLQDASNDVRFTIADPSGSATLNVSFAGALPDNLAGGGNVVLTGSLQKDGRFIATQVAEEA